MALCRSQSRQAKSDAEKRWFEKLKLANPHGIKHGRIFLEQPIVRPLTEESVKAVAKYRKIFLAKGFKENKTVTRYKKESVKMSEVWPLIKELDLKFRPIPNQPVVSCSPERRKKSPNQHPDTQHFRNKDLFVVIKTHRQDITKNSTLVDVFVTIRAKTKPLPK